MIIFDEQINKLHLNQHNINNYYPFGLKHKGYNSDVISEHRWKYNGKELQNELELNWYNLGARNLDHALGRFMNVDPKAEQYNFQSTYAFANNNPVLFVDINGEGVDDIRFRDKDGNLIATYKTKEFDDDVYLPISLPDAENVNLNEMLSKVGLEDVDVVGIGGDWDFTFAMGGGVALEAIYFLDGNDAGTSEIFKTKRQNVGLNGSAAIYGITADYYDDTNLKVGDYSGRSYALSAGVTGVLVGGFSKFWAPKPQVTDGSGFKSLFNQDLRAWSGYNIGGGVGAGFQWSKQNTEIYKKK